MGTDGLPILIGTSVLRLLFGQTSDVEMAADLEPPVMSTGESRQLDASAALERDPPRADVENDREDGRVETFTRLCCP